MNAQHPFCPRKPADIVELVEKHPLSWFFATDERGQFVTAVPVRPRTVNDELHSLIGHVPRAGRLASSLQGTPVALVLILGPDGYISPSWFADRTRAPTWNYAAAQFVVEVQVVEDPDFLEKHLRDLTGAMERGRHQPWSIEDMGTRYLQLSSRIVAFEARIRESHARFKLGQDEPHRVFSEILTGLQQSDNDDLLAWMRSYGSGR